MSTNDVKASRKNLQIAEITAELARVGCEWVSVHVLDRVESTNDEALARKSLVSTGQAVVVTADEQVAGRGRLDRNWSSPWGAGIALTISCSSDDVTGAATSVPLRAGRAVVAALDSLSIPAALKWPNDVVTLDDPMQKIGGILVQLIDDVFVIGIGLNVSLLEDELPTPTATSLHLMGHQNVRREELIARIIAALNVELVQDDWISRYRDSCRTLGTAVRVTRVGQSVVEGIGFDISDSGALKVKTEHCEVEVSMGDVEHLRPAD